LPTAGKASLRPSGDTANGTLMNAVATGLP
jgi:hypothetical protein